MSPSSFLALLIVAGACVGLATHAVIDQAAPVSQTTGTRLAPDLTGPDAVARVTVRSGEQQVTLRREGEAWRIDEKGGYPADPAKVRALVTSLAMAELIEHKTAAADRLKRLDLEPIETTKARSKEVRMADASGKELAAVIVGKTRYGLYGAGRSGAYVRKADEHQAWLADRPIAADADPLSWIDKTIVDLPRDRIGQVVLQIGTEHPVELQRAAVEADPAPIALPEGRAVDPEKLALLAGWLDGLTTQDVRKATDLPFGDRAPNARFTTNEGVAVAASVVREGTADDAAFWVRFDVTTTAPAFVPPAPLAEAPAASTTRPADASDQPAPGDGSAVPTAPAAAVAEAPVAGPDPSTTAAELKGRLDGWAFKLPRSLAERIGWQLEDLLVPRDKTS